ncbi:MAG: polymer-forming cytoskeletal protein [Flavobacteriales bacterium]|nr:polymer-forming cytoskeletal protein [Flavobacteriales bacterium]
MFAKGKEMAKNLDPQAPARNRIGPETTIKGEIISDGNFRIDGTLEGSIKTKGKVVVGEKGLIQGEVLCQNADVEGTIKGKLQVTQLLALKATAKIHGDILVDKLSIEPGANFTGSCKMGAVVKELKDAERKEAAEQSA